MELFDILKLFFKEEKWEEVTKHDKGRNFFMVNRIMGISFPLQANAFNHIKIDPVPVIDYWKNTLNTKYSAPPGWFFTTTAKKEKDKKFSPKEEVTDFIRARYEISSREIMELSKYYPKEFKKFCDSIEDLLA